MLRPVPARWFEALVAQDDAAAALEALAATGTIELELRTGQDAKAPVAALAPLLDRYVEFAASYRAYWPKRGSRPSGTQLPARTILEAGLTRLEAWREQADRPIRELQALELERVDLAVWRDLFTAYPDSLVEFDRLRGADRPLTCRLYLLPAEVSAPAPAGIVTRDYLLGDTLGVLALGPSEAMDELDRAVHALKGRPNGTGFPAWLAGGASDNLPRIERQLAELETRIAGLYAELDRLERDFELTQTVSDMERLRWFALHVDKLPGSECLAWLTGWTSDVSGDRLRQALADAGVRALLHLPLPPADAVAPLVLDNPWWARPFEIFARAIGVPAGHEVDPSPLLAVIAPLLFGYMFGDVGQGLVIIGIGLALRRRLEMASLLVAGGAAAVVFGVLFGSVFAREDWLPALWLHPLEAPLLVLAVPLMGGMALLTLGLILNAVEASWRGVFGHWLHTEAGIVVFYGGALAALVWPDLLWLAVAGLVWFVAGSAWHARRLGALLPALGAALEHAFQLAVNTLSFARVGAFALAHAGLSSAIVVLAEASSHPLLVGLVMVVGNAIVIALEGLVVSIQTTRLVVFEFFIRFLRGEGRALRPLTGPVFHVQGGSK